MSLFILHEHASICQSCKRIQSFSRLYEPRAEGAATRLAPFHDALPADAIVVKSLVNERPTPICWSCVPSDDDYRKKGREAAERWAETIRRKRGEALLPSETRRFETSKGKAPKPIEELA